MKRENLAKLSHFKMILPKTEFRVPVPDPLLVSPQASTLEQTLTLFPKLHQFVFTQVKVTYTPGGGGVLSFASVCMKDQRLNIAYGEEFLNNF